MRVGNSIFLCKLIQGSNPLNYEKPIEINTRFNYLTIQPERGYTSALVYGKEITKWHRIMANYSAFNGVFHEGDLLYIDGAKPSEDEDYYGEKANAVVDSVLNQNLFLRIMVKNRVLND